MNNWNWNLINGVFSNGDKDGDVRKEGVKRQARNEEKAIPPALWLSDTNEVSNVESVKLIKVT